MQESRSCVVVVLTRSAYRGALEIGTNPEIEILSGLADGFWQGWQHSGEKAARHNPKAPSTQYSYMCPSRRPELRLAKMHVHNDWVLGILR